MADYQLLIDLHKDAERQGPGGNPETKLALDLLEIDKTAPLKIADIGCGTGASTLVLAEQLDAQITAVDFLPDFLEVLETRAKQKELSEKISTLCCSMENLPFNDAEFDVIWSEGAIYNIGFEKGIKDWHRYLKPGGLLVVSEITWLTNFRPLEIQKYWEVEYSEIDLASAKFALLEEYGYSPIGYFVLPEHCWLENYYQPMQVRFQDFLKRNNHSEDAHSIVEMETREIELYEQYKAYYSYGVYIARKLN
ncbi:MULTISPECIES: class I SAM-dependent methyltransferase [Cyanophyceae]|uniref:class I SAM-dependent methyltransferase n=1 Tax=Cyanophyceae TaxID=3028117 RepID=UPI00016DC835|nr:MULTISPECIES: methyltransferase domain-containing protein [Cyanophyceae]ACA98530.1 SAM-dependent methyltransferase [Picosynechococcus sp. PCC 7002]SMH41460.1 Methyltransferase domain-containing protein [Picosynechococcus sp. OG1]SMQ78577.1 Methyltransferase domain-containing protein [Synechococcus sp. 7002]